MWFRSLADFILHLYDKIFIIFVNINFLKLYVLYIIIFFHNYNFFLPMTFKVFQQLQH